MEDLWGTDDIAWANAPVRHIEFPDMVERRKEHLLEGKGARHDCGKRISAVIRTMRCAALRSICGAYSPTTAHVTWPSAGDARRGLNHGQSCSVNSTERRSLSRVGLMPE
jgi:hypothetical protein